MKTYLTSVAAVLENEVVWQDSPWYAFANHRRRREAIQQANRLLQSFTLEELVDFSDQASALASVPYKIYQDAVSHLFAEYKGDAAASGRWKIPRLKENSELRIFDDMVRLYAACEKLKQRYSLP